MSPAAPNQDPQIHKTTSTVASNSKTQYALCISYIVQELIRCYDQGETLNLTRLKGQACKKFGLKGIVRQADILQGLPVQYRKPLWPLLKTKPVRTAAGVAVVAVMSKPHRCPHIAYTGGVCVYCPGGLDSDFEYSTQAYTGYEPTSMRAIRARYDPYSQVKGRVHQLRAIGHTVDKVEFIVMGGTFLSLDKQYKDYFIRNLHDALSGHHSHSVEEAVRYSEQAVTKCIGITIGEFCRSVSTRAELSINHSPLFKFHLHDSLLSETRPDYCLKPHLEEMLSYGCTRIEIGVQSVYESIARETNRGHTVSAVSHSFHLAKDCGFKVVTHLMPDLPNTGYERDLLGYQEYFENPAFRSDGIKLYPTLVIRGTGLYELWKTGRYQNYTPQQLVELTAQILSLVPPWTRLYRIQRDIPMPLVSSGVEHGNLRELALAHLREHLNVSCMDIRSREVGMKQIHSNVTPDQVELLRRDYTANGGWETFLSYEDPKQDILIGLLRLRKLSDAAWLNELTQESCSMVRELHVYGTAVAVSARDPTRFQHQGFGILLMEEAERIAREEHGSTKLLVIAGVGTRHYYRKMGYKLDGPYMSKSLLLDDDDIC